MSSNKVLRVSPELHDLLHKAKRDGESLSECVTRVVTAGLGKPADSINEKLDRILEIIRPVVRYEVDGKVVGKDLPPASIIPVTDLDVVGGAGTKATVEKFKPHPSLSKQRQARKSKGGSRK